MDKIVLKNKTGTILEGWEKETLNAIKELFEYLTDGSESFDLAREFCRVFVNVEPITLSKSDIKKFGSELTFVVGAKDTKAFFRNETDYFYMPSLLNPKTVKYLFNSKVITKPKSTTLVVTIVQDHKKKLHAIRLFETQKTSNSADKTVFKSLVAEYKLESLKEFLGLSEDKVITQENLKVIAKFQDLQLTEDGKILEEGQIVGKIDTTRKKKQGKFEFLKVLMDVQGREGRSDVLINESEIKAKLGNKDIQTMYSKINSENLSKSSYKITKSGTGYMLIRTTYKKNRIASAV